MIDTAQVIALEAAKLEMQQAEDRQRQAKKQKPSYDIPDDAKVLIATPNYTNVFASEAYVNDMVCASLWKEWGINYKVMVIGRTFVHFARSQACRAAIDGGFTHIFWRDDDAIVPAELLPRFLSHRKDVVISPYPMRRSPFQIGVLSATNYYCRKCDHRQTCGPDVTPPDMMACEKCGEQIPRDFHDHASYRNLRMSDMDKGLIRVDGGGTHAMLITTKCLVEARGHATPKEGEELAAENRSYPDDAVKVFQKLMHITDKIEDREMVDHYIGDLPDESMTFVEEDAEDKPFFVMPKAGTEDMLICYRMLKKGIKIWCDTDAWADHIGFAPVITKEFTREMERLLEQLKAEKVKNPNRIAIAPVGLRSRNHASMDADTQASLV
jgi:hypothetical protein